MRILRLPILLSTRYALATVPRALTLHPPLHSQSLSAPPPSFPSTRYSPSKPTSHPPPPGETLTPASAKSLLLTSHPLTSHDGESPTPPRDTILSAGKLLKTPPMMSDQSASLSNVLVARMKLSASLDGKSYRSMVHVGLFVGRSLGGVMAAGVAGNLRRGLVGCAA